LALHVVCERTRTILVKAIELDLFTRLIKKLPSEVVESFRTSQRHEEAELQVEIAKLQKHLSKAEGHHRENEDEARDPELKAVINGIKARIKPKQARLSHICWAWSGPCVLSIPERLTIP
jgi:hypothetical protein